MRKSSAEIEAAIEAARAHLKDADLSPHAGRAMSRGWRRKRLREATSVQVPWGPRKDGGQVRFEDDNCLHFTFKFPKSAPPPKPRAASQEKPSHARWARDNAKLSLGYFAACLAPPTPSRLRGSRPGGAVIACRTRLGRPIQTIIFAIAMGIGPPEI